MTLVTAAPRTSGSPAGGAQSAQALAGPLTQRRSPCPSVVRVAGGRGGRVLCAPRSFPSAGAGVSTRSAGRHVQRKAPAARVCLPHVRHQAHAEPSARLSRPPEARRPCPRRRGPPEQQRARQRAEARCGARTARAAWQPPKPASSARPRGLGCRHAALSRSARGPSGTGAPPLRTCSGRAACAAPASRRRRRSRSGAPSGGPSRGRRRRSGPLPQVPRALSHRPSFTRALLRGRGHARTHVGCTFSTRARS